MTFKYDSKEKTNSRLKNAITKSQRSSCQLVFARWQHPERVTLEMLNATTKGGYASDGGGSSAGNLLKKPLMIIDNDVVRVSVTNNKGASSGSFSIVLKRGKKEAGERLPTEKVNYLDAISPGDWVYIFLKKSGTIELSNSATSGLKMIGVVENVRFVEVDDPSKGSPRLEYVVTGRSYGKIFDMSVYFNPTVASKTAQTLLGAGFLTDAFQAIKGASSVNGTQDFFLPDELMKALINFYYGGPLTQLTKANQTWYVPADLHQFLKPTQKAKAAPSFIDILDLSRIGLHKYSMNKFTGVGPLTGRTFIKSLPSSGTVWSLLQYLANLGINEMFVDMINKNGKLFPAITIRQLPFSVKVGDKTNVFTVAKAANPGNVSDSQKTFFIDLPRYVIKSSDVKQKNVGKSDFERINHIVVVPRSDETTYEAAYVSALNITSIQRYGLKSFQIQTPYVLDTKADFQKYCENCVTLLTEWFFLNHSFYNGTIIVDGADGFIELGTNLLIDDVKQLFHIEGYTHTYEVVDTGGISYTTELRVSRGQRLNGSNLEFIGIGKDDITISTGGFENVRNTEPVVK